MVGGFVPDTANHITVTGGGPSGLALDEARGRLYVMTRFDNGVSVVDTATRQEVQHLKLYNPEPASVVDGRRFLYDAAHTSSHGDSACASCHVFADFDGLSWDLGDPDGANVPFLNPDIPSFAFPPGDVFPAMKGPMNTQSLRGMDNHGPMHWRGDRTGATPAQPVSAHPDTGAFDEQAAFRAFNPAFVGLVGRHAQLAPAEMQAFTDFILQVSYPPNPVRNLDNALTSSQAAGRDHFFVPDTFLGGFSCNDCHTLDPTGNAELGVARPGFFGTDGRTIFDTPVGPDMPLKVPHLRNVYQKTGRFGAPDVDVFGIRVAGTGALGDQMRGFGLAHDGSIG